MEIAPISGIRVMPAPKIQPSEPTLSGVFDITLSRSRDDSYSGSRRGAGGQDDENDEQDGLLDDDARPNRSARTATGGISIFA
jgi:hypothetical protein